jgi:hypothetical protein
MVRLRWARTLYPACCQTNPAYFSENAVGENTSESQKCIAVGSLQAGRRAAKRVHAADETGTVFPCGSRLSPGEGEL